MQKGRKGCIFTLLKTPFGNTYFGTMNWKDFLYFQRGERIAVILLLILIVLTLLLNMVICSRNSSEIVLAQNDSLARQFEEFRQSLKERPAASYEEEYERDASRDYRRERNYPQKTSDNRPENRSSSYTPFPKAEKLAVGETISLNETDTAQWKKIPGIGSSYAARIVKYRNLLGGFSSTRQLLEVYGIDNEMIENIAPYLSEDGQFTKLNVNTLEFNALLKHPYLNYKQVKAITDLRRKKGRVESLRELEMLDEFTAEDVERLKPYLVF